MNDKKPLVVITGASAGIGAAAAKAFASLGHPLLLIARREEKIKSLQLPNTMCAKVDVTDQEAFRAAVSAAEREFGPTDCLVNNAGTMMLSHIAKQNPNEWKAMLDTNILGVLNGMQAVMSEMVKRRGGTIINVSSIAGRKLFPNHGVYCASKFAVHALTETARAEVSQANVRVITISPGVVETELLDHTANAEIVDNYKAWKQEMGEPLNTDDVARSILFAYQQPQSVCIREIILAPTRQEA